MDIDKLTWRKVSDLNSDTPRPVNRAALREELKYLRSKERFIKHGHYLPMTTHNYQLAANACYFGVVSVNRGLTRMKLSCGHWHAVPQANPLPAKWMDAALRFCEECADKKYRAIVLAEIEESRKAIRARLPHSPWWMRILTLGVVIVLGIGLSLQAFAMLRPHPGPAGAFDPRSDDNAEGQCP